MTRDELIEKVATIVFHHELEENDLRETTLEILNVIFDALQEPTEEMETAAINVGDDDCLWQAMLNASPLAKEGDCGQ